MPVRLEGSCRCGAVGFAVDSHTPQPYQRCYCTVCRKTAGGGGYAVSLAGVTDSLQVTGSEALGTYHAMIEEPGEDGVCRLQASPAERRFCTACASTLWLYDPRWPELVHPFASAIDSELPQPPSRVHLMLRFKASWVQPHIGPDDACFEDYPEQSIEDWHKSRGLWVP